MFPSPTADPIAARRKPNLVAQESRPGMPAAEVVIS
jgi:hypothetical protein